jgi:hypothetical protein
MGGYLAGRLRTQWVSHTDEVYFARHTASGFAVYRTAAVLASATGSDC